jgi:hypothetical protein
MAKNSIIFATDVKRVKLEGQAVHVVAHREGGRFYAPISDGWIALSKGEGCLLGETLADKVSVDGNEIIVAIVNSVISLIKLDGGIVTEEYISVSRDDLLLLLKGMLTPEQVVLVSFGLKDILDGVIPSERLNVIDDDVFDRLSQKYKLIRVRRRQDKKPIPIIFTGFLLFLFAGWFFLSGSNEDEGPPPDPYAEYKADMQGLELSSALDDVVHAVSITTELTSWQLSSLDADGNQITMVFKPTLIDGLAKEFAGWATSHGYKYVFSNGGVSVSFPYSDPKPLNSNLITNNVGKLTETTYDLLNSASMFKVGLIAPVAKSNYVVYPMTLTGEGMVLNELLDLSKIVRGVPFRLDSISIKSTDVDYVFNVVVSTTVIGA